MAKEPERGVLIASRYSIADAARLIPGLSRITLRAWALGRHYPVKDGRRSFEPILSLPDPGEPMLSFTHLVEAHILYGLRSKCEISIPDLRTATDYCSPW